MYKEHLDNVQFLITGEHVASRSLYAEGRVSCRSPWEEPPTHHIYYRVKANMPIFGSYHISRLGYIFNRFHPIFLKNKSLIYIYIASITIDKNDQSY